jgi:hypothetical protein
MTWTLAWDKHPKKRVHFRKDYLYGNNGGEYISIWGEGFQGPDDPKPMIDVNTPSVGRWTLMLNNEDSRAGIGVPVAREVWEAMIHQGWIVDGEERDHHESF